MISSIVSGESPLYWIRAFHERILRVFARNRVAAVNFSVKKFYYGLRSCADRNSSIFLMSLQRISEGVEDWDIETR